MSKINNMRWELEEICVQNVNGTGTVYILGGHRGKYKVEGVFIYQNSTTVATSSTAGIKTLLDNSHPATESGKTA